MIVTILLALAVLHSGLAQFVEAPYASWAHSHVVWINGKQQNQHDVIEMVHDYLASKDMADI